MNSGLMGNIASALGKMAGGAGINGKVAIDFVDNAPPWSELEEMVKRQRIDLNHPEPSVEEGPPNPLSLKRTHGKNEPIRVKLYRDHAAWCPYCQKVWLQLEEKKIPYVIEKINMRCYGAKPNSFLNKVPSGLLPVMELDGKVYTESDRIAGLLESEFTDTPLLPPSGSDEYGRAMQLLRLERQLFGDWLSWLVRGYGKNQLEATLDEVNKEMQVTEGPYFLQEFSLVDCFFAPFLERLVASLQYYKGFQVRNTDKWPAVERWFTALETRPTYISTKSDFYTHSHDLPPQLGGCKMEAGGRDVAAIINGQAPGTWRLPLPPLNSQSLPEPYTPGEDPPRDRLEAAAKLVGNHANVAKFAARGAGTPGSPGVSAPLSDPNAMSDELAVVPVDKALRHVAHALLVGYQEKQDSDAPLKAAQNGDGIPGASVIPSLEYLRDRVGVPRDFKYPAARQFRAHLNWAIDEITTAPAN